MEAPPSKISAEPMVKLGAPDVREEGGDCAISSGDPNVLSRYAAKRLLAKLDFKVLISLWTGKNLFQYT
ncbi:hypothetical protein [Candidatus Nitrotoga sp. M5]|uniref:hypothetical protein n=1 Tax=Candidatus Nitrotoga sp. M5 TaxID=2890409 RepID=UPI001EF44DF7|nr:hypothetical protein [Candidatus Nitrotoga sp. M5]